MNEDRRAISKTVNQAWCTGHCGMRWGSTDPGTFVAYLGCSGKNLQSEVLMNYFKVAVLFFLQR